MRAATGIHAGFLLAALVLAGCSSEPAEPAASSASATAPSATPAAPPTAARSAGAEEEGLLSVLSVEQEVDVLAQRDGVVVEILQDEGSWIERGAILARLDDRNLQVQMERARADLEVAQNNAKYNEAELKARQAAYRRAQEMREHGLNSDADLEEAEFKAKGAEYDLQSWKAVVERTRADIRLLELELEKTRIRAPFSSVVARRYLRAGQNVLKDEKCYRVSQLAPLLVRFLVPEATPRRPRVGDLVNVAPVSDGQRLYTARVQKVSPTVDPASGSYDVTARLTEPDLKELRPGMSVRVLFRAAPSRP